MPDSTRKPPLSEKRAEEKLPSDLTLCIVSQYARALRVDKRLPASLSLFIVN